MSATTPQRRISEFLADTGEQYSSGVEKYTEGEKMAKKELDEAQAAYDKCNSDLESYKEKIKENIRDRKTVDEKKTKDELRRLMTNEKRAKNELTHAQIRYDSILRTKTTLAARENALRLFKQQRDSGAGVNPMAMPHVDPALPNLEVNRGTMAMAVPGHSDATSAQRSPSPVGCWGRWCKSNKRDSSPSSKTAGGRKYKSKRFKTKRTYKKRRTSRK